MSDKKELFIATRVNEKLLEMVDEYCINYKISRSKLLRNAILYFLKFAQEDSRSFHPMMIFSKQELKYVFECLNIDEIREFADISFKMGEKTRQHYADIYSDGKNLEIHPRTFIKILNLDVFSHTGQNWFKKISFSSKRSSITMVGLHVLNRNFSSFVKYLMTNYMDKYDYKLTEEKLSDNRISLEFLKSKDLET